jgi:hypothetical protein
VGFGAKRDYSDLLVFNEDNKEINGLLHVHLPEGPTAHYRLSNLRLGRDIKVGGWAAVGGCSWCLCLSHKPALGRGCVCVWGGGGCHFSIHVYPM